MCTQPQCEQIIDASIILCDVLLDMGNFFRQRMERLDTYDKKLQEYLYVSSISLPLRPKGRNGLVLAPWSGAPNQSMVGGPPSHSAIKRGWGPWLAVQGLPRRRTHPTSQTLTDPREHWSGGKLRHRRLRDRLPGSDVHGATARRSTASSPSRHCFPFVKPRPPLRPRLARWPQTPRSRPTSMVCVPCFPSVTFLVVLGVVDLDLGDHVVYL
jgi:hypothetical protein